MKSKLSQLIQAFKNAKIGFVGMRMYQNRSNEVSSRRINIGYNYGTLNKKKLAKVERVISGELPFIEAEEGKYGRGHWDEASAKMKNGIVAPNKNISNGQKSAYINLTENGSVKYNPNTQEVYINGLTVEGTKVVYVKGEYKKVNSSPVTLARKAIEKAYMREFQIGYYKVGKISDIAINGDVIEITPNNE